MNILPILTKLVNKKNTCSIFGHKTVIIRKITNHFEEYKCTVCEAELTNDLQNRITFLTPELKDINETLLDHFRRRRLSM